ncbi:MAG: UDP-3-O-(3-hydroxymyristoyl)glucosamine N-acyltransferase [Gammaproteobacteria bacterium]
MTPGFTLADLARRCAGEFRGEADIQVRRVATLQSAIHGDIAFLANPHYKRYLTTTRASVVILSPEDESECPVPVLIVNNPYLAYAQVATLLAPSRPRKKGIERSAHVDPAARIHADAWIGPGAVVAAHAIVERGAEVGPNCVMMEAASLGEDSRLVANVTLCDRVSVGKRGLVHPGVVIGADGFGIARDGGVWVKVPQLGSVRIGDDVEIGANTTIDRGALEDTVIEDGVKLDNQIQIAHNVHVGAHTAIAGCAAIAGSTVIGKRCMIAGAAGITGHLEICDDVVVTAMTLVTHSIHSPGIYSGSLPMDEADKWRKNSARFRQLDELARRLASIEKKLKD